MTTIVRHRRTGNKYILLGINGDTERANPSRFINDLFSQEKSAASPSATLCDVRGNMFLAYIDDLIVVEVDGIKPEDILPPANDESSFADSEPEEFADDDFDDFEPEVPEQPPSPASSPSDRNSESLDAPTPNSEKDEDEDWI